MNRLCNRELINYACDEMGVSELANKIRIEWSKRFTRRLACANYYHSSGYGYIKISTKLWPTMTEDKREDLILHEVAHVIDIYLNGYEVTNKEGGHGFTWRQIAKRIGAKPERYAKSTDADFERFKRKTSRYSIPCECGRMHVVTKHKLTRMKNNVGNIIYHCRYCRRLIKPFAAKELR